MRTHLPSDFTPFASLALLALAALPALACSSNVSSAVATSAGGQGPVTTGEGGSGGSGGQTDPGAGGSPAHQGGMGGTGSTTTAAGGAGGYAPGWGGSPALACDPAAKPYVGSLCGPPESPCAADAVEVLAVPSGFRNGAPAVTVGPGCVPHLLFSLAGGGYHGSLARRVGADDWQVEPTPFDVAGGALLFDGDVPLVLRGDGGFDASLFTRAGGAWSLVEKVPGEMPVVSARAAARDAASGTLYGALMGSDMHAHFVTRANAGFTSADLGGAGPETAVALGPDGAPHVVFWGTTGGGWVVRHVSPPGAAEDVDTTQTGGLDAVRQWLSIALSGVDLQPHVLTLRTDKGPEVIVASRTAPGAWTVRPLDHDTSLPACPEHPQTGDTCDVDQETVTPLGAVSAGAEPRFFYAKGRHTATLVADCQQSPAGTHCTWNAKAAHDELHVRVGWLDAGGALQSAEVAAIDGAPAVTAGSAAVDASGAVHLAWYADKDPVRYLRVATSAP